MIIRNIKPENENMVQHFAPVLKTKRNTEIGTI